MSWLASSRRSFVAVCLLFSACASEPDEVSGTGPTGVVGDAGGIADSGNTFPDSSNYMPPTATDGAVVTYGDGGCGSVRQETEKKKAPADIVWALDNSGSMGPYILAVNQNMTTFIQNATMAGADMGVTVLTAGAPTIFGGVMNPNFHPVDQDIQSTDAFRKLLDNFDKYKGFLRPGAPTHFVVVTDDASDMPSAEFIRLMEAKLGHKFTFHAINADITQGCPSLVFFRTGIEYVNTANATGGEKLLLCSDWGMSMQKIQGNLVASLPLPCDYTIPPPPGGQSLDKGAVQVLYTPAGGMDKEFGFASDVAKCADNLGWYYDNADAPTKVIMCPKACEAVKAGGAISIGFGCAPSIIL